MARDADLEKEIEGALDAFLKSGGCGEHGKDEEITGDAEDYIPKCCAVVFISGIGSEFVYPESVDELEADDP